MSNKVYLPGLNGLRAIAALAVVFSHININLDKFSLPNLPGLQLANFGVTIFFTLSGFLITFLLLREKSETKTISIKKFYLRRTLRIWPLYFVYLAVAVLYAGVWETNGDLAYYLLFIPNVIFATGASIPLLTHYWSLGVEEQFYAFWPLIIKHAAKIALFLGLFIVVFVGIKVGVSVLNGPRQLSIFLHYTRFSCMGIGGLAAYYYFHYPLYLKFFNKPIWEISAWIVLIIMGFNQFHIYSIIDHEIAAFFTVILILNQVSNANPLLSLERKLFDYLGKISFGIYVYNPLVIDVVSSLFVHHTFNSLWITYTFIYVLVPSAVILTAYLSYRYIEEPFLKIKDRYSIAKNTK